MRSPAITTTPDTTIERAAEIMIRNNVGALPIVEEKMIGIVSRTDLIKTLR
jgi:CBS domain-containing protein